MADHTTDLDTLDPISLDQLLAVAELQTRKDRKYLIAADAIGDLLADVEGLRVLDIDGVRDFQYESVYFDTPERISYLSAAQRRPHRFKVRTRTYLDTATSMLEVKVRDGRGRTVKHRHPYEMGDRCELTADGRTFIHSVGPAGGVADELRPTLMTTYRRSTLVVAAGEARATIDTDVTWHTPEGASTSLAGMALIETKTPGRSCDVDRALWRRGLRPTTISKYCTGLAALHPELPANKWHRVLQRHLGRRGAPRT